MIFMEFVMNLGKINNFYGISTFLYRKATLCVDLFCNPIEYIIKIFQMATEL